MRRLRPRHVRRISLAAILALEAGAAGAQSGVVTVRSDDCRHIVAHHPAPDVAYKPGVDVHGRSVVPADLTPPITALPDAIQVDLRQQLSGQSTLDRSEISVGALSIDPVTGAARLNGQLLPDAAQHAIAEACLKQLRR